MGDVTFHELAVATFRGAGLDVVVVVNAEVAAALPPAGPGEHRVTNPDPDQASGMFASVKLGVFAARGRRASGVILLPVDHPLVTVADIEAVRARLNEGAAVVVAVHDGRRGHPIGISRAVMDEITSDPGLVTLRDVVHRDRTRVVEAAVTRGGVLGVNTPEDLDRVSNRTFR